MPAFREVLYWLSFTISTTVVIINVIALSQYKSALSSSTWQQTSEQRKEAFYNFLNTHNQEDPDHHTTASLPTAPAQKSKYSLTQAAATQGLTRRSRTLVGIISSDTLNDSTYRKRHRELFSIWNDPRVCSLPELKARSELQRKSCQLVYTFVIGAADATFTEDQSPATLIANSSVPLLRSTPLESKYSDINFDDVSLLNIKENMNEGKSPTFFYFASTILEKYDLDYAMKLDGDSMLHLHDWFLFAHGHLPPRPYARHVFAGALRHKAYWPAPPNASDVMPRLEGYWVDQFDGVHLYLAGQCYLMSLDLCQWVAKEAPLAPGKGYMEGHEDHDVSSMVFQSPNPVHMLTIGKSQRFWEHPVKGQRRWERIQARETARVQGKLFEGKQLRVYWDP